MLLVHLARTVVSKEGCDLVLHNVEREAVQRHVPTMRGVNVAHEWLHEPDVRRIHDFGDLMPLPDLQWLGL